MSHVEYHKTEQDTDDVANAASDPHGSALTRSIQYFVSSDRVVLGAPLRAGGSDGLSMYHATDGQPDRPVTVIRLVGFNAAAVARREVAFIASTERSFAARDCGCGSLRVVCAAGGAAKR